MSKGETDLWHFVCDDHDNAWTWRRVSPAGEEVGHSSYSFRSFNACVADAELAGFVNNPKALRRVRTSELAPEHRLRGSEPHTSSQLERRRRAREFSSAGRRE